MDGFWDLFPAIPAPPSVSLSKHMQSLPALHELASRNKFAESSADPSAGVDAYRDLPGKILAAPNQAPTFGGILGGLFGSNANDAGTLGGPLTLGPGVVPKYLPPEFRVLPPARDGDGRSTSASPRTLPAVKRSEGPLAPPPVTLPPIVPPPVIPLPVWQRIAMVPVGLTGALATAILLASNTRTAKQEDDEFHPQYVIRAGESKPRPLQRNTKNLEEIGMPNEYGMSSSTGPPPMKPEEILAVPKYSGYGQYSWTIVPELNALGYRLERSPARNNPLHSSILLPPGQTELTDAQAAALSAILRRKPNPYYVPGR